MVHSGPFNGLCEIESSRGSPGISNIFLSMLQLLHPSTLSASSSIPPFRRLLHDSAPFPLAYDQAAHLSRILRQDLARFLAADLLNESL